MKLFTLLETSYNNFTSAVKNYLNKSLSNNDSSLGNNTIFGQLINVLSSVVQNMMLYIEDALVEQNKYTAQRKKSIYGLAAISGYEPFLGKASGVQISINFLPSNSPSTGVIINNHQQIICNQNGLPYNIILPQESIIMSVHNDSTAKQLYAIQGRFESQIFISTGGKYYTQNFNFLGNLDEEYLEVYVNDEKWEKVVSIYDMSPDGKQWTYKISPVNGIDIIFGNDKFGRSLKADDVIKISYLLHDGEVGNIDVTQNTFFIFKDLLYSVYGEEIDGNNIFNLTCSSLDAVTSGMNSESVEQVRKMIGLNSRSLVLSDVKNYKQFLSRFSMCGYNRTWSEPGSMVINSVILKNYKMNLKEGREYFNLNKSDFLLSEEQKSSIKNCIENTGNQLAGATYNIIDPELCKYAINLRLKMKKVSYEKEYIITKIKDLLGNFFADLQADKFIPKSDIIHLIKSNIDSVDGIDVYILSEKNETAKQKGYYHIEDLHFDPNSSTYKKISETIHIYPGEDPGIGLDVFGNIMLSNNNQYPILMGSRNNENWDFVNSLGQQVKVIDPLNIIFE